MDTLATTSPYKQGFKTSEFWLVILNTILGIPIALGYVTPEEADTLSKSVEAVVGGMMVIIPTVIYIYSRIAAKRDYAKSSTAPVGMPDANLVAADGVAPLQYAK